MKKNNFFLSLSLIILTLQLGCSKNALFHTKPIRQTNSLKHNAQRPAFNVKPNQSINSKSPVQNTIPKKNSPNIPSKQLIPTNPIQPTSSIFPAPTITAFSISPAPSITTTPLPPKAAPVAQQKSHHLFQDFFPYRWIQKSFQQITNENNKTTLFFQAFDHYGFNVRDLQKDDLHLSENQIDIKSYTLSSERERLDHKLEVVFVINTAGSMERYIDMIKNNITYLVNKLEEDQMHVNLCLVTFRDSIEKRCRFFYPDNPLTLQNENVLKFLDDISRLRLHRGYNEYHENVLGGMLEAIRHTPWNPGNQRMIILATDALFWIPLYNSRPESREAPDYQTVLNALKESNIQLFALTQDYNGFSKDYFKCPSLVEATSGQWFNIKTLEERNIQNIFNHIREQLNIFYKIEYFVEYQEGLNPFLALEDREINLTTTTIQNSHEEDVQIEVQSIHSNLPEGADQLLSHWPLNEPDIKKDNVTVTVNRVRQKIGNDFFIENGQIFFEEPPPNSSEILVRYEFESLINNVKKHPLILQSSNHIEVSNLSLFLNEKKADQTYFEVESADDGSILLNLRSNVFSDEDPFNIRQSKGLSISFSYEAI